MTALRFLLWYWFHCIRWQEVAVGIVALAVVFVMFVGALECVVEWIRELIRRK